MNFEALNNQEAPKASHAAQTKNNPFDFKKGAIAAAALLIAPFAGIGLLTNEFSSAAAPQAVALVQTELKAGEATFKHSTDEKADELTYTANTYGVDSIEVEYNDGIHVFYSIHHGVDKATITVDGKQTEADVNWNGNEVIFTTENNTTKLGGFRKYFDEQVANRNASRAAAEAYQAEQDAEQALVDGLSFDGMVSEISKKTCAAVEQASYISNNTIVREMNKFLPTYRMSTANQARWNGMNARLRTQHVTGAMNFDCNNVMMVALENSFRF